jgi:hypothetical protein
MGNLSLVLASMRGSGAFLGRSCKLASLTINRKISSGRSSKVRGPWRWATSVHSRSLPFRYLKTVDLV